MRLCHLICYMSCEFHIWNSAAMSIFHMHFQHLLLLTAQVGTHSMQLLAAAEQFCRLILEFLGVINKYLFT